MTTPDGDGSGAPGPPASLQDHVLETLGRRIVEARLAEGATVRLEDVDEEFGVSRSVSREAIRVLVAMGLVATRRRVGVTVQPRGSWQVFDPRLIRWRLAGAQRADQLRSLTELRGGMEPTAAALAASRARPEQGRALLDAALDMADRVDDLDAYLLADQEFHRTLLAASGNEMLAALADVVDEVLAGRTHHDLMPARPEPVAVRLHEDVARAVRAGDPVAAEAAMRAIVDEAAAATAVDTPTG